MQDRGYIKWAPFNSVLNDKTLLSEILNEKKKYKNQNIIKLIGYINGINVNKKHIFFNKSHIYFNQILKITNFFE